ncbi:hypothetical protein AB0J72_18175 [Dactylosporangium sp. NPDC049742]|uniref:hypothetical protein n=1 Tax=Dactylosporangium sp. NPDC049742 TaxID=3154737 RepID=UPI00342C445A
MTPQHVRERRRTYLALGFLPFMLALYCFTPRYRLGRPRSPTCRHRSRTPS